eukprot:gnl/TRDRNA2_/TRDRNA2_117547_c0_seq1.p1 gnl/TRDRNA2_/TRDRNA2_117547_c0~~gnl/TRDRNA2_/TRDRNA2_117547_c0_seq1.p1  ORF type:complete len:268 (-),score=30.49 gnl/TRDRNA2_/TRDRNA2_117547_c0_seq1:154-957(-)
MDYQNDRALDQQWVSGPPVAQVGILQMIPPSPYFRPQSLVCPRGRVFLADQFRVFELDVKTSEITVLPCSVNGTIADLTATCTDLHCWPIVLLEGFPPQVLDCQTERVMPLLQATDMANRLTAGSGNSLDTMFSAHGSKVFEYRWSAPRKGWAPWWQVANVDNMHGNFQAIDTANGMLLLIHDHGVVETQDYSTGRRCGLWKLPPGLLGGGCAENDGSSLLLLVDAHATDGQDSGPGVNLMRAVLPKQDGCRGIPARSDMQRQLRGH